MTKILLPLFASLFFFILSSCQSTAPKVSAERTPAVDEENSIDSDLHESRFEDEGNQFQKMAEAMTGFTDRRYDEGRRPAIRDFHAKAHGCVKANFHVEENLDKNLAKGVFVPGATYKAWVRFSNGDSEINPDSKRDARGMAIKLLGIDGEKILSDERNARTQDFVMVSSPAFFINDPSQYLKLLTASKSSSHFNSATSLRYLKPNQVRLAAALGETKLANPLEHQYWSTTPSRLSDVSGKIAIKFSAKPCDEKGSEKKTSTIPKSPSYDFLREVLASSLASHSACFDFYIQRFQNLKETPIEDATVEWKTAPFEKIATITIPIQTFVEEDKAYCENLSFTPWHSLPNHKPLGAVNRARKVVYMAVSKRRHQLNSVKREEPSDYP